MKSAAPILLAALAAGSLWAEETRFGVQLQVASPRGDLKQFVDGNLGPGLGLHATLDLGDGQLLRPRLDYTSLPEATFGARRQRATSLSLGSDYLFFVEGKPEGLYFALGLAAQRWSLRTTLATSQATSAGTRPGVSFGIGYLWTETLGTELRYGHSRVSQVFSASTLQAEVTLRF
ncbi:MAG: outer membrane beta-barrel protein [Holophagaceae bacterium]|nr:outer membrane beta-barrel protein [Acidobacteriota bacterium]